MQKVFIDKNGYFFGTWDPSSNPSLPIPSVFEDCIEVVAEIPDCIKKWNGAGWDAAPAGYVDLVADRGEII